MPSERFKKKFLCFKNCFHRESFRSFWLTLYVDIQGDNNWNALNGVYTPQVSGTCLDLGLAFDVLETAYLESIGLVAHSLHPYPKTREKI